MRLLCTLAIALVWFGSDAAAEEGPLRLKSRDPFGASRYRALRLPLDNVTIARSDREHPMLPALRYAYERYDDIRRNVKNYRGKLIMRERIQGRLKSREYMELKVRHTRVDRENQVIPFAVYLNYLAPTRIKGREVLYVEGRNDGKMVATRGGGKALNDITLWLKPDGERAMRGNHYPITDFGVLNLARRLIEHGTEEMQAEASRTAQVRITQGAKINKRPCTMIEIMHPARREGLRYHIARIFIDDEYEVPIRFASYSWPREEGELPLLMEEYTYLDLELNVGFTDADFDSTNSAYRFREPRGTRDESSSVDHVVSAAGRVGDE